MAKEYGVTSSFDPDSVPTPARAAAQRPPEAAGPRAAGVASQPAAATFSERSSPGTPPRAWLWRDSDWVPVRIVRSMPDGKAVVRLPGGQVVNVQKGMLRPRTDGDEPPAGPPPQPSSRSQSHPNARRPSWEGPSPPTAAPRETDRGAGRPSSAPPSGRAVAPAPAVNEAESEGGVWAAERMERLRKELQAIDEKSPADKRFALRQLQRELHPDKQPPELRPHAQPLFMLVQKEWEITEACAKAAA